MTPRSRKPVIIGAMLGLTTDNYHQNFINFPMDEVENSFDCENTQEPLELSLHRSKSESSLLLRSPIDSTQAQSTEMAAAVDKPKTITKSNSDETLSTPFR